MLRISFTLLVTATLLASAHATPPADRIFPDSTKGFVSIANLETFGEQWSQTQFGRLLDNPLMQDFKEEVQTQITDRLQDTFGLTLDGITSLPSGELALGMVAMPGQTPGYVLTMDVAGKRAETDQYLAELSRRLVASGARISTETHRGQRITILTFPPPTVPRTAAEPIERRAHYMFFQDILIASDRIHLIHLIADRIAAQAGGSLADVEAYQVVMRRCLADLPAGVEPIIRWYIDPLDYGESVRVLLRGPVAQERRGRPSVFEILKSQGFDALQGVGGVVTIMTEAQESVYRTFVYTKKPYRLAMQMFNFPDSTNFTLPNWMPADLARCTVAHVEPLTIFDNFGPLFDAFLGEPGVWNDIMQGLRRDPDGPQIDIRGELVANLGNRVLGMSHYAKPITTHSESLVVAVELREGRAAAMRAGLEKLFGNDPEMQVTVHHSYRIWHRKPPVVVVVDPGGWNDIFGDGIPPLVEITPTVSVRPVRFTEDDEPPVFPDGGVVAAGNYLIVATNIDYLKVVLDRLNSPVLSTIGNEADYRAVQQVFAGWGMANRPRFFQFFVRAQETIRPTYEMLRQGQMGQNQAVGGRVLNAILSPEGDGVRRQTLDGSTLPEFERIQHYFGEAGIYGVTEADGYFIKGFTLAR